MKLYFAKSDNSIPLIAIFLKKLKKSPMFYELPILPKYEFLTSSIAVDIKQEFILAFVS